jgi:putative MATE family efflux protein
MPSPKSPVQSLDLLNDPVRRVLFKMTWPMMMGIVSLMLFNLADIYFVGQLGTEPMAALAFTFPVTFAMVSLAIGFGIGTSAILARLMGSGEHQEAASMATDNLLVTFVVTFAVSLVAHELMMPVFHWMGAAPSLIDHVVDYMSVWWFGAAFMVTNMVANSTLRARGDTKIPAIVMAASSGLNFILDPLLIFGIGDWQGFGIKGAAMASVIAWCGVFLTFIWMLYHKYRLIVWEPFNLKRIATHWGKVMKIGFPAALSNMMTPIAGGILTSQVALHGPEAVAAFGVGTRLESLSLLVCLALSMTLPPFVSQNLGAGQFKRVRTAYLGAVKFALVWQLTVFILLWLNRDGVAHLFADSEAVIEPLMLWISIVPLGFGMQAVIFLSASTFNALHQPMRALRISITRLFIFCIPMAWVANHLFGLQGMFMAFVVANTLSALFAFLWVNKQIKRSLDSNA